MAQIARKLGRARRMLEELQAEMDEYDQRAPWTFLPEVHPLTRALSCRVTIEEEPDPEWELVVGEIAYQARSSLDQLVAVALAVNGGDVERHRGGFPIAMTEAHYLDRSLLGTSAEFQAFVDSVQPFTVEDPPTHPLAELNELCNADKHRSTQASLVAIRDKTMRFSDGALGLVWEDKASSTDHYPRGRPFKDNDLLAHPIDTFEPQILQLEKTLGSRFCIDQVAFRLRIGVCFGTRQVFSFHIEKILNFVQFEVVARVTPLLSHGHP